MLLGKHLFQLQIVQRASGLDSNPLVDAFAVKKMQARQATAHLAHTNIFSADHARLL